jgi:hypothetical protein
VSSPDLPLSVAPASAEDLIEHAFRKWDNIANHASRSTLRFSHVTAFLGPVAVLLLTTQLLALPEPSAVASALIGLEALLLAAVLSLGFLDLGPRRTFWPRARVRAEVLRRETYLLRARLGPYLVSTPLKSAAGGRLEAIDIRRELDDPDSDSILTAVSSGPRDLHLAGLRKAARDYEAIEGVHKDPLPLIGLDDEHGSWRDTLEDCPRPSSQEPAPNIAAFLDAYRSERLEQQREWFTRKAAQHQVLEKRYDRLARAILLAAFVVAVLHLMLLLLAPPGGQRPVGRILLELAAIVLPPVSMTIASIQSLKESHRLSRSYKGYARLLEPLVRDARRLSDEAQATAKSGSPSPDLILHTKRLVLRTEQVLAGELRQWYLIMMKAVSSTGA